MRQGAILFCSVLSMMALDRDGGRISLRLIELLSRVRADLKGGWVVVSSGSFCWLLPGGPADRLFEGRCALCI